MFEHGFPVHQPCRHARWQPDPLILDDQALAASARGHGRVVLTGCGRLGIVNILRYAQKLTAEDHIHAIAARLPDAFIQNSVGTRFEFS